MTFKLLFLKHFISLNAVTFGFKHKQNDTWNWPTGCCCPLPAKPESCIYETIEILFCDWSQTLQFYALDISFFCGCRQPWSASLPSWPLDIPRPPEDYLNSSYSHSNPVYSLGYNMRCYFASYSVRSMRSFSKQCTIARVKLWQIKLSRSGQAKQGWENIQTWYALIKN